MVTTIPKWIVAMPYQKYGTCKDCGEPAYVYGRQKGRERCKQCWGERGSK